MSVDPKVGSMIPEDLSTNCSIGSMIQSDPMVKFDSRTWIPLDPSVIFGIGSWIPSDPWWNLWYRINHLRKWRIKRIPRIYQALTMLFLDKISTKSWQCMLELYFNEKCCYSLQNEHKNARVSFDGDRIRMDPDTIDHRSRLRMGLLPYCEDGSMMQCICRQTMRVDLWSERIRDPDPCDQIPGSVFGIHGHVWWRVWINGIDENGDS